MRAGEVNDEQALRLHTPGSHRLRNVPGRDVIELPGISVALIVRHGASAEINEGHQAIAHLPETRDHLLSVQMDWWRELYLETNYADHSDRLIDVQLELTGT